LAPGNAQENRANNPESAVIMLTQYGTIKTAIEATKLGAATTSPNHSMWKELHSKLDRIGAFHRNRRREPSAARTTEEPAGIRGFVGISPRMQRVYKLIQKVAQHIIPS